MSVDLDNTLVSKKENKSPYCLFFSKGKDPDYVKNLKQFGEVGFILKRGNKIKSKISDRGKKAIMVGYTRNSTGDTYRMYNLSTNKITNTRDVNWMNKIYEDGIKEDIKSDYYTASEEDETEDEKDNKSQKDVEVEPRRS